MKRYYLIVFLLLSSFAKAQTITTFAGFSGGIIYDPSQLAFDRYGNLYCGEGLGNQVIKIDTAGIVSVFAGTGVTGYGGDGGPATAAVFNQPSAVVTDTFGNVYIGDAGNNRVRKVNITTGIVTTIAGTGTPGYGGDGGAATAALLDGPPGLYIDKYGDIYLADYANYRIRKINTAGIITTIAGNGLEASTGDGGPATAAACVPDNNMCMDVFGNLYFNDNINSTIRKIDTSGIISTIAGDSTGASTYIADGVPALGAPMGPDQIAFNEYGELVISDAENNRIRMVDSFGIIHTIAGDGIMGSTGDGGPATSAELNAPAGIAYDQCGNLYIAQVDEARIRKVIFDSTGIAAIFISPSPNDTVCAGTSVTYTSTVSYGSAITYQWDVDGTITGATGNSYTYTPASGDYVRCVLTGISRCSGDTNTVNSNTIYMVVTPVTTPTITLTSTASVAVGSTVTVNAVIAGAGSSYSINWYNNGVLFSTTTTPSVTFVQGSSADVITATVIPTTEGCSDSTNSGADTIMVNLGINNVAVRPLHVYPNPVNNEVHIDGDVVSYKIMNIIGATLLQGNLIFGGNRIDISSFAQGIYMLEIMDNEGGKTVMKIVKQ